MSLYLLRKGNMVYSTRIKITKNVSSKTCLVGLVNKKEAVRLQSYITSVYKLFENELVVQEIDYKSIEFSTALRLNNLAILIASDFTIHDTDLHFNGDILNNEHDIDNDNRKYLNVIFDNS